MPSDLLSAQLVIGVVVVVLVVVGLAFFARTGARPAAPTAPATPAAPADRSRPAEPGAAAPPATLAAGDVAPAAEGVAPAAEGVAPPADDLEVRSGPGTYGPIQPAGSTSVFETEPCWVSMVPGWARARTPDPATGPGAPAAGPTTDPIGHTGPASGTGA